MNKIRYLSLFSGIEAFSQAVEDLNFEPVGFAEIEPFACEVLKTRYPDVKNYGDVSKIDGTALKGKVDLIVGGSPCQDFSQAGGRLGLEGERSSLAIEYIRLLNEIQPYAFIWENVPGCTSTNNGNDLRMLLEAFQDAGYVLDADILDSQFFGIPQRRRRIFVCGINVEAFQKKRTTSSALIIAKCLLAILQDVLIELRIKLEKEQATSVSLQNLSDGLLKKINFLFQLGNAEKCKEMSQENSEGDIPKLIEELKSWDVSLGKSPNEYLTDTIQKEGCQTEQQSGLIEKLSKKSWEGLYQAKKLFTILTETNLTILEIIYICAKIAMNTAEFMARCLCSSPNLSIVDMSDLTPLQEFTKYARWTSSSLLGDVGRADYWSNFIREASLQEKAFRNTGADRKRINPLLFEFQGMSGYSPQSGEARQNDTRCSKGGAGVSGEHAEGIAQNDTFATLCASGAGCDRPSAQGSQLDFCVVDSPAYAVRTAQTGANGIGIDEETAHTLDASGAEAVAFAQNHDRRQTGGGGDVFGTLMAAEAQKCWLTNQNLGGDCWVMEKK